MEWKLDENAKKSVKKDVGIGIALFLMITPISFFWTNELVMSYNGNGLTNGFWEADGLQNYHLTMYYLFFTNFVAAFFILRMVI